jgi:hypothetical protein
MRRTGTATTPDNPEPRQFHLEEAKAKTFAAKVIADGGTAAIGPFEPSRALRASRAMVPGWRAR